MSFCCCCLRRSRRSPTVEEAPPNKEADSDEAAAIELARAATEEDDENLKGTPHPYPKSPEVVPVNPVTRVMCSVGKVNSVANESSVCSSENSVTTKRSLQQERCEVMRQERQDFLERQRAPMFAAILAEINSWRARPGVNQSALVVNEHMRAEAQLMWRKLARMRDGFMVCSFNSFGCSESDDCHGCLTYGTSELANCESVEGLQWIASAMTTQWYENGNVTFESNMDRTDMSGPAYDRDREHFRDTLLNPDCSFVGFHADVMPWLDDENERIVNRMCLVVAFDLAAE